MQLVYRHFPLNSIHANAQKAAEAAEAAGVQDAFWPYHDALYAQQAEWSALEPTAAREFFIGLSEELDLDVDQFTTALDDDTYADEVATQEEEAMALGLTGTPSVILDGQVVTGESIPLAFFVWDAYVQLTMLEERQYDEPPPMTIDVDASYQARVQMESGDEFVIELFPGSAPQTVNSFVFLAEEGWFDGATFHRVLPGFVAQTGDPTGTGFGDPGYTIPDEIDPDLSHAEAGMVAMANSGPNTNGSQWYVTLGDVSELDGRYTIFGRVIEGMDVVEGLMPRDPSQNPEAPPGDRIARVIIEKES